MINLPAVSTVANLTLRVLAFATLAVGLVSIGSTQQPARPQAAFTDQYCVGCHSDSLKTGGLSLEAVNTQDISEHPQVWEKVVRKLRARAMPPVGLPRPDEKDL